VKGTLALVVGSSEPALSDSRMGCQPAAFNSLPNAFRVNSCRYVNPSWRQSAANYRLAACAPQK
jgi:hypothetical protein